VDTADIGITDADADVLVRRGTAIVFEEDVAQPAPAADAPEVIHVDQPAEAAEPAPAPTKASRKR
jgi:hypothetical protein